MLFDANIINGLLPWLNKKQSGILVPVLECLSALVHGNEVIANEVIDGVFLWELFKSKSFYFIVTHQRKSGCSIFRNTFHCCRLGVVNKIINNI